MSSKSQFFHLQNNGDSRGLKQLAERKLRTDFCTVSASCYPSVNYLCLGFLICYLVTINSTKKTIYSSKSLPHLDQKYVRGSLHFKDILISNLYFPTKTKNNTLWSIYASKPEKRRFINLNLYFPICTSYFKMIMLELWWEANALTQKKWKLDIEDGTEFLA